LLLIGYERELLGQLRPVGFSHSWLPSNQVNEIETLPLWDEPTKVTLMKTNLRRACLFVATNGKVTQNGYTANDIFYIFLV
jgi:hypothetical protein